MIRNILVAVFLGGASVIFVGEPLISFPSIGVIAVSPVLCGALSASWIARARDWRWAATRGVFVGLLAMAIGIGVLVLGAGSSSPFFQEMAWTALYAAEQTPWVALAGALIGAVSYRPSQRSPLSGSQLPVTSLVTHISGAVAFSIVPTTVLIFNATAPFYGWIEMILHFATLCLIPGIVGGVAFPLLIRARSRVGAAARVAFIGFTTLAGVAGVSWAAGVVLDAPQLGWVSTDAINLAFPVAFVASSVGGALWRKPVKESDG